MGREGSDLAQERERERCWAPVDVVMNIGFP